MSTIVNVRGTNGSGKTTLIKKFLALGATPLLNPKGKPRAYKVTVGGAPDTYILGAYETPTGGCDGIKTQDDICNLVREFAPLGDVLFEGLLVSGLFSRYSALADELKAQGHHTIFSFLDTPLEKCISQTLARRAAKGNDKPFDPYKTLEPKFQAILASRRHLEGAGQDCRTLPHGDAAFPVLVSYFNS